MLRGNSIVYRLRHARRGATAIEYGLIAALIAVAAITAFTSTGDGVEETMTDTADALPKEGTGGGSGPPTPP